MHPLNPLSGNAPWCTLYFIILLCLTPVDLLVKEKCWQTIRQYILLTTPWKKINIPMSPFSFSNRSKVPRILFTRGHSKISRILLRYGWKLDCYRQIMAAKQRAVFNLEQYPCWRAWFPWTEMEITLKSCGCNTGFAQKREIAGLFVLGFI